MKLPSNIHLYERNRSIVLNPNETDFEVVERKFRGHPDSIADIVAQVFTQKYIKYCWNNFTELDNTFFPNFSSDKIVLSGASCYISSGKYEVLKPVDALLLGKITQRIGRKTIPVDEIFKDALETVMSRCLGHDDYKKHLVRRTFSVSQAGTDHDKNFYDPISVTSLLDILKNETHANDTVFVVAYSPLSTAEKLSIFLDNLTASSIFKKHFPAIGTDIKVMIRRRSSNFDITMCLPVFPEKVQELKMYNEIIKNAKEYIYEKIIEFVENDSNLVSPKVNLWVNTKDTETKKYFAVWGTSLSKGDIGAVGRGNRQQGFISGLRPSTNEAMSGKNPNHFSGIVYQLVAEDISTKIFFKIGLKNAVYITANNGDMLIKPNSIDIILSDSCEEGQKDKIHDIITKSLESIPALRMQFINSDPYLRFMGNI